MSQTDRDQQVSPVAESAASQSAAGRRGFLRRASLGGAVMTTIAARPAWGQCSISGAMSGGSARAVERTQQDCHTGNIVSRSPGFWGTLTPGQVKDEFSIEGTGNPAEIQAVKDRIAAIQLVQTNNSFLIPSVGGPAVNVAAALADSGGLAYNLAAIWCTAYFRDELGRITFLPPGTKPADAPAPTDLAGFAQLWVSHFDALVQLDLENGGDGDTPFGAVFIL